MGVINTIASSPVISTIVATAIGGIIVRLYQRWQNRKQRARKWYETSLGQLGRLQQAAQRATEYQDEPDYDSLRERLEPLTEEMIEHANSAPAKVSEQARIDMAVLSAFATGLIILSEQSEEMDVFELYETVQEHARESYDGDYDMDDIDEIFGPFDIDEFVEETDTDVDLDEERAEEFLSNFSEESVEVGRPTTVEEALNMPIGEVDEVVSDDDYLESMLEDSLEAYVRTALMNVIEDTHEAMETRKKLV
ncbi:hypothetical protein [Halostella salina]|uniref:hypothetical protein n=1 Tax=Halobacteriales TaxID=2235 RepID=UPI0013CF1020|nr:hypothetical protein [Halostella salina]